MYNVIVNENLEINRQFFFRLKLNYPYRYSKCAYNTTSYLCEYIIFPRLVEYAKRAIVNLKYSGFSDRSKKSCLIQILISQKKNTSKIMAINRY